MRQKTREDLQARGEHFCRSVTDLFECEAVYSSRATTVIRGRPRVPVETLRETANARLNPEGFRVSCEAVNERYTLCFVAVKAGTRFPWVNIVLFIATVISVIITGGYYFAFWLIAILLLHELGHYAFSRIRGVEVSLPYFIPAPIIFIFGTLGAVIKSRTPVRNRRDLLDIAAAGPIAGFVVAVAAIWIGLAKSELVPIAGATGLYLGDSLLLSLLSRLIIGPIPEGMDIALHPIAFAGWTGLLVTMLNLLPIWSLDGGHIAYALFGRHQEKLGYATIAVLLALSFFSPGWLIWVAIAVIMGPAHPPTLFDEVPVGKWRRMIGYLCFVIFILCFTPVPFRV